MMEGIDFWKNAAFGGMSNVSLFLGGDDNSLRESFTFLQE